jgi:Cft2 family RNA processing exonuclease
MSGRYSGADPVDRVLITAAEVLNAWRSTHPTRRPGRARPWLNPSWPPGLLLGTYRDRLLAELASDQILRAHTRARLGIPALLPAEAADIVSLAECIASAGAAGDDSLNGKLLAPPVTPKMLATALLALDDETAQAGVRLVHDVPKIARKGTQELDGDQTITDPAHGEDDRPGKGKPDHGGPSDELRQLRRQSRSSAAEVRRLRAELADASADADGLREEADQLTRERDAARAAVPSQRQRGQLANATRLASDLKKTRKRLGEVHARHESATQEHHAELRELRSALVNAEAERDKAIGARHRLERQLGDLPWRAHYLQNLLKGRIEALEVEASGLQRNQARSRIEREIGQLRGLSEHIAEVLPASSSPGPADCQSEHEASGSATAPVGRGGGQRDRVPETRVAEAPTYEPVAHAGPDRHLRVEVLGGGNEIGGSAILVEAAGTRILVDAGVRPNADSPRAAAPPLIARAMEGRLDGIVVTHGHNDHAGFIPKLIDSQPKASTVCTPATAALLPTMWNDARRVMARQADEAAEYGWLAPLYGEPEIEAAEKRLHPVAYGRSHVIKDLTIQLFDAGHILGAAGVVVSAGDERVVVTGDIFNLPQMSVGRAQLPPRLAREADLLVIESTYCHSPHRGDRASQVRDLVSAIEEVVSGGGRVLIPAFGLGRAQEVALIMRSELPDVDVLIDGLARQVSEIYEREAGLDIFGGRVQRVRDRHHRHRLMQSFPSGVVITTSGMLSGGFAVPWAQEILPDPHSALFICGYQDEESPGRSLQRLARRDDPDAPATLRLPAETGMTAVTVAARVETYSLSAHADRNGLLDIIGELSPANTMLVHGVGRDQKEFRETLERARSHRTVRNDIPWKALP